MRDQAHAETNQALEDRCTLAHVLSKYGLVKVDRFNYACNCIPCGGVMFSLIMLCISYVSGMAQVVTLAQNGHYIFAGLLVFFLIASFYHQMVKWSFLRATSLAVESAETGVMNLELVGFFMVGAYTKDAFTLFLAPYCVLMGGSLSLVACANCSLSLLLGFSSMSTELVHSHLGGFYWQFGEALVKRWRYGNIQLNLLHLWAFSAISSQMALNAMFMRVFHPLVLLLLYLPLVCVNFCAGPHSTFAMIQATVLEPGNLVAAFGSSVFGFGQWDPFSEIQQGNRPALHHCAAQLLRNIMMLVLMCFDLPADHIRPMGLAVYHDELFVPVQALIQDCSESLQELVHSARIFTYNNHTCAGCFLRDVCPMASGSSVYKALLQLIVVLGLPVYAVGMMVLLVSSTSFRTGKPNEDLNDALTEMFCEIAELLPGDPDGVEATDVYQHCPDDDVPTHSVQ